MRWRTDRVKYGETRVVTKFLYFPKNIKGDVRWLEVGIFRQTYSMDFECASIWLDICWLNK